MPHRLLRLSRPSFVRERNGWTVLTERDPQFKRITTKCPFKREGGMNIENPRSSAIFCQYHYPRSLFSSPAFCPHLPLSVSNWKRKGRQQGFQMTPLLLNSNVIFEVDFKESGSEGVKKLRCKNMCCVMISWKARLQHF